MDSEGARWPPDPSGVAGQNQGFGCRHDSRRRNERLFDGRKHGDVQADAVALLTGLAVVLLVRLAVVVVGLFTANVPRVGHPGRVRRLHGADARQTERRCGVRGKRHHQKQRDQSPEAVRHLEWVEKGHEYSISETPPEHCGESTCSESTLRTSCFVERRRISQDAVPVCMTHKLRLELGNL